MGNCKDCRSWDKYSTECNAVDYKEDYYDALDANFHIFLTAHDDQGLDARLKCGPDFGCVQFQLRSVK